MGVSLRGPEDYGWRGLIGESQVLQPPLTVNLSCRERPKVPPDVREIAPRVFWKPNYDSKTTNAGQKLIAQGSLAPRKYATGQGIPGRQAVVGHGEAYGVGEGLVCGNVRSASRAAASRQFQRLSNSASGRSLGTANPAPRPRTQARRWLPRIKNKPARPPRSSTPLRRAPRSVVQR